MSKNKYEREIFSIEDQEADHTTIVDVYEVLESFNVTCPARQHAAKKILCSGIRGKGNSIQDLTEARDAITRAIELETRRLNLENRKSNLVGLRVPANVHSDLSIPNPAKAETSNSSSSFTTSKSTVRGGQSGSAKTGRTTRKR